MERREWEIVELQYFFCNGKSMKFLWKFTGIYGFSSIIFSKLFSSIFHSLHTDDCFSKEIERRNINRMFWSIFYLIMLKYLFVMVICWAVDYRRDFQISSIESLAFEFLIFVSFKLWNIRALSFFFGAFFWKL